MEVTADDDLFVEADETMVRQERSPRVKGSGLGLAIVKGFVQLSEGTVRAESSPAGARFIIRLPARAGAKASA